MELILKLIMAMALTTTTTAITVDDCVEYVPGNFNMIVTAPHGGSLNVPNCPYRSGGCLVNGQCFFNSSSNCLRDANCDFSYLADANTQQIARLVVQNIANLRKKTPHLVIMKCTRATLDVNREINEAAQGCPNAETAFNNYHNKIKSIISGFTQGKGLLIDIHGQGHKQNSTELGYGIDKADFDSVVSSPTHTFPSGSLSDCTINALRQRLAAAGLANDYDILVGKKSMATFLEQQGFAALPGPTRPVAGATTYQYFNGGYTIRTYSSATMDAIQMEGPGEVRVSGGLTMMTAYANGLANAVNNFFNAYYS